MGQFRIKREKPDKRILVCALDSLQAGFYTQSFTSTAPAVRTTSLLGQALQSGLGAVQIWDLLHPDILGSAALKIKFKKYYKRAIVRPFSVLPKPC